MRKLNPNSITFKNNISIAVLLTLFAVIISSIGIRAFNEAMYEQYEEGAFGIAESAVRFVNGDKLYIYEENGGTSEDYQQSWKQLDRICNGSGAMFIYVIRPDLTDYGHIRFVFSTVNHNSEYSPYEVGFVRETTNDEYREKYRNLYEGTSEREVLVLESSRYSRSEYHITAMVPVKNSGYHGYHAQQVLHLSAAGSADHGGACDHPAECLSPPRADHARSDHHPRSRPLCQREQARRPQAGEGDSQHR